MSRRNRVEKTLEQKLRDLDELHFLLRGALQGLRRDSAHVREVAGHLRSLVCFSSGTEGLLWRMAEHLEVSDEVEVHLAGGLDPTHPLARGMTFAIVPILRKGKGPPQLPSDAYSLKEIVKEHEAVFVDGKSLTHEQVIKSVAQQLGGAHESDDVDPELLSLAAIRLGNVQSYVGILVTVADLALEVAGRTLDEATRKGLLQRKLRVDPSSNLTIAVRVRLRDQLAGRIEVVSFKSAISAVTIRCFAGPTAWTFELSHLGRDVAVFSVPYPADRTGDIVFSLEYRSHLEEAVAAANGVYEESPSACPIGYLYAEDLTDITVGDARDGFVDLRFPAVFKGNLGSERLAQLLELTPELLDQLMQGPGPG